MANLHFLSLLEALMESNSAILNKLLPIWSPVLFAFHVQVSVFNMHFLAMKQHCAAGASILGLPLLLTFTASWPHADEVTKL